VVRLETYSAGAVVIGGIEGLRVESSGDFTEEEGAIGERNVYGKKVLWVETIGRAVVRSGVIECKDELVVLSNSDC